MIEKLESGEIASCEINANGEVVKIYPSVAVRPSNENIIDKINEIIDFLNERLK